MTLATLFGYRWHDRRSAMFRWGEVSKGWGLAVALCHFEDHWSLHLNLVCVNLYLCLWPTFIEPEGGMESYGFSWRWGQDWSWGDAIHLNWGPRCKILHMPWGWEWQRTSLLAEDGRSWVHELKGFRKSPREEAPIGYPATLNWFSFRDLPHWKVTLPYLYMLRSGEQQHRNATISVGEMEWRMRALQWLSWPRLVRRSIEVTFDDEVGERAGSWKGGCVGCAYTLLPDETPQECLQRMMQERKF
jgi:hypothetical protein